MKRTILLILAVMMASFVARRIAKPGMPAQQRLLWVLLLSTIASPVMTASPRTAGGNTAKTKDLVNRVNGLVAAAADIPSNGAFLETLNAQTSPTNSGSLAGYAFSNGFGGGVWSSGQQSTLVSWLSEYNGLVTACDALSSRLNQIYSLMVATKLWT